MAPLELRLDITPRGRLDVIDVRAQAAATYGGVFDRYNRCLYCSLHTTAGYLPQSFAARLGTGPQAVRPYIERGELVSVLESFFRPFPGFYLYYPARRQTSSALRALIDHLLRLRQSQPAG